MDLRQDRLFLLCAISGHSRVALQFPLTDQIALHIQDTFRRPSDLGNRVVGMV
jgi:hypothetical protein